MTSPLAHSFRLTMVLCSALGLSACGNKYFPDTRSDNATVFTDPKNGDLSKSLNEVQTSKWVEKCDLKLSRKATELVTLLDQKADAITAFAKSLPPSKFSRNVRFGDSILTEYVNLPAPQREWTKSTSSWNQAYSDYLTIKDQPINAKWIYLNSDVRSLVTDDRKRVLGGRNMQLHYNSGPTLGEVALALKECKQNADCFYPNFSLGVREWVRSIDYYEFYMEEILKSQSSSNVRDLITRFASRVEYDNYFYQFHPNPSITATADSNGTITYTVPMTGPDFSDQQRVLLQSYIEKVWQTPGAKAVVEWRETWENNIFKIFFEKNLIGSRAYVDRSVREMHLFPRNDTMAIAHETGHVIGFPDLYYTVWDKENCSYTDEYNTYDLMSSHYVGKVTQEEWAELKKQYPAKNQPILE